MKEQLTEDQIRKLLLDNDAFSLGYAYQLLKPRQRQELIRAVQTYAQTNKTP